MKICTILIAACAFTAAPALAQTAQSVEAQRVTPDTHCKDGNGTVRLKQPAIESSVDAPQNTGTAGANSNNNAAASAGGSSTVGSSRGSGAGIGMTGSTSHRSATNLPSC